MRMNKLHLFASVPMKTRMSLSATPDQPRQVANSHLTVAVELPSAVQRVTNVMPNRVVTSYRLQSRPI